MAREPWDLTLGDEKPLIQTAFRLGETDLHLLDLIRARYDLRSRTAALRFVLRWWKGKINE